LWQGFVGVQPRPDVHETHEPVLHTRFWPQLVPSVWATCVSVHVSVPPEQTAEPLSQAFPLGVQPAPFVHALQSPALQYAFVPHWVPSVTLPLGEQTGLPVPHAIVILLHDPVAVQSVPAAQVPQTPLLQTPPPSAPASQPVPSVAIPVDWHASVPASQTTAPTWHWPGEHVPVGVHDGPLSPPKAPPSSLPSSPAKPSSPAPGLPSAPGFTVPSPVEAVEPSVLVAGPSVVASPDASVP
jgi:hypothetical protein